MKALEAAEAAKRLAEKKENDRKMRKEALKLERARFFRRTKLEAVGAKEEKERTEEKRG